MFKKLQIDNWKHIKNVAIDFHPRITIITGANGSGKSTIIRLLARHQNWSFNELGTPEKDEKTGLLHFFARRLLPAWFKGEKRSEAELGNQIGTIDYTNNQLGTIHINPNQNNPQYNLTIHNQQAVKGIHIPAYRPQYTHQPIQSILTSPKAREQVFAEATNASRGIFQGNQNLSAFYLKETLLNWIHHGYGSAISPGIERYKILFHSFEEKLRIVLPKNIGFEKFETRNSELVLVCKSGHYLLDASSGGITALIDLTWQIFLADGDEDYVVVIDEIENHLHPSMQRSVLQDLSNAFPNARFIVSTHSPFVISSVEDSFVYAFIFNDENRVESEKLDLVDKAATANEILREVLGVPVTYPLWLEKKLDDIIQIYQKRDLDENVIKSLSDDLRKAGLANLIPMALTSFLSGKGK